MKVYVDKLDKPDVHLCQAPHRFGKNDNLNRKEMSNRNKTCFQSIGIYPHTSEMTS